MGLLNLGQYSAQQQNYYQQQQQQQQQQLQADRVAMLQQQLAMQNSYTQPAITHHPQPINLEEGAWDVAVSQLVDLWTIKYGSKWVKLTDMDEFYAVATKRLNSLNKLESHHVNGETVYRIVE